MRANLQSLVLLAVSVGLAAPACAQTTPLAGSEWRPVEIDGVDVPLPEESELFVRFGDDGKVEGNGGCNQFFGGYQVDGEAIDIGPLASTKMLCPEFPGSEIEDRFLQALDQVTGYQRDETTLELTGEGEEPIIRLVQTDAD